MQSDPASHSMECQMEAGEGGILVASCVRAPAARATGRGSEVVGVAKTKKQTATKIMVSLISHAEPLASTPFAASTLQNDYSPLAHDENRGQHPSFGGPSTCTPDLVHSVPFS